MRHYTVKGIVQQNRVAERMNITFLKMARIMLSNVNLSKEFWAEAVSYACQIINRLPAAANEGKTPLQVWSGSPATDYDFFHIFGCHAYYHVQESKLDPRAKKAIFMGFSLGVKGYRLWCTETKKTIQSRDVTFNDFEFVKPIKQVEESIVESGLQ